MRIGIDLDEVTVEFLNNFLEFYYKKTGRKFKHEDFFLTIFGKSWVEQKESIDLVEEFSQSEHFENNSPIKDSPDSIRQLSLSNEIFFITSRPHTWKEKTEKWIEKHLPTTNHTIIYSGDFHKQNKTKAEICKELRIDIFLEDNKEYAFSCAEKGIKVILFNKPWNKGSEHPKVIRVSSWKEAIDYIKDLDN